MLLDIWRILIFKFLFLNLIIEFRNQSFQFLQEIKISLIRKENLNNESNPNRSLINSYRIYISNIMPRLFTNISTARDLAFPNPFQNASCRLPRGSKILENLGSFRKARDSNFFEISWCGRHDQNSRIFLIARLFRPERFFA